jgi:hypothetical protein
MSQAEALQLPAPRSKYGSAGEPTPQANTEKPVLAAGRSPLNRSSMILRSTTPDISQRPNARRLAELAAALTLRDVATLSALDQYRYLDAAQIEALYYTGQRRCELRLSQLRQRGLLARWIALNPPGWSQMPSVYALSSLGARSLSTWRGEDPRPLLARSEHARTHRAHVVHDLEANSLFVLLAAASRSIPSEGLQAWVGEDTCRHVYRSRGARLTPDGWGRYLVGDRQVMFFLEWDRSTESPKRIREKVGDYVRHFAGRRQANLNHVLFVTPRRSREVSVAGAIRDSLPSADRECCRFWTTTVNDLHSAGPLGKVWGEVAEDAPIARLPLAQLPSLAQTGFDVSECIGKERWWELRLRGAEAA